MSVGKILRNTSIEEVRMGYLFSSSANVAAAASANAAQATISATISAAMATAGAAADAANVAGGAVVSAGEAVAAAATWPLIGPRVRATQTAPQSSAGAVREPFPLPKCCLPCLRCLPQHLRLQDPSLPRPQFEAVLPAVHTPVCSVVLERRPSTLAFNLLRVTALPGTWEKGAEDVARILEACEAAIALGAPLLVLCELQDARLPPMTLLRKLLNLILLWGDRMGPRWDALVQGLAMVVANAFVRSFMTMVITLVQPPQPIVSAASTEEALSFLSTLREAKSYVKASYTQHGHKEAD